MSKSIKIEKEFVILLSALSVTYLSCLLLPAKVVFSAIPALPLWDSFMLFPILFGQYWSVLFLFRASLENFKKIYFNIMIILGFSMLLIAFQMLVGHWESKYFSGYYGYNICSLELVHSRYSDFLESLSIFVLIITFLFGIQTGNLVTRKYQFESAD